MIIVYGCADSEESLLDSIGAETELYTTYKRAIATCPKGTPLKVFKVTIESEAETEIFGAPPDVGKKTN